jgi:hypothetical protein
MSKEGKLVTKLNRRRRSVVEARKPEYREDMREEVMQHSPRAYRLMRKPQRRMDKSFGYDTVATFKEPLEYLAINVTIDRYDFGGGSFGIRMVFPYNIVDASGVQVGDTVVIEQQGSPLEGHFLAVTAITSTTTLRLDDYPTFSITESGTTVRIIISGEKKSYF